MPQTRLSAADADFVMKLNSIGYSNSEIARKLGVTEGAIRYRIKRRASSNPDGRTSKPSTLDAFREWIGAWIEDYQECRRRPTLRLLEQMLREHHGYRPVLRRVAAVYPETVPGFSQEGGAMPAGNAAREADVRRLEGGSSRPARELREPGR